MNFKKLIGLGALIALALTSTLDSGSSACSGGACAVVTEAESESQGGACEADSY